jgi:glutamate-ammonia-ligase adenylyltransferase
MALARSRVLYGPEPGRGELERIVAGVLAMPRDAARLRGDVLTMRAEMARHKPAKGPLDVKLARGGLVDIEFLAHFLQLRDHTGLVPSLPAALARLIDAGLLPVEAGDAHALLSRVLVSARLLAPDAGHPLPAAAALLAKACRCADWRGLEQAIAESRRAVAQAWALVFGEELELDS